MTMSKDSFCPRDTHCTLGLTDTTLTVGTKKFHYKDIEEAFVVTKHPKNTIPLVVSIQGMLGLLVCVTLLFKSETSLVWAMLFAPLCVIAIGLSYLYMKLNKKLHFLNVRINNEDVDLMFSLDLHRVKTMSEKINKRC